MRRYLTCTLLAAVMALPGVGQAARSNSRPPSMLDSFRLGSGNGALCRVQSNATDKIISSMFDRSYSIVCRDAARSVGQIYALRSGKDDPTARVAALRAKVANCDDSKPVTFDGLAAVSGASCKLTDADIEYVSYRKSVGKTVYFAEGLAGYDSAVRLAFRSIVEDRLIPGEIAVATSGGSDPTAFARVQAGSLDLDRALAEGYRRNNSGNYAEAAEFFETLLQRTSDSASQSAQLGEYVVNRALQKSNLGDFAEADALFAEAAQIPTADPVQLRLRRNFQALHLLNQRKLPQALTELSKTLAPVGGTGAGTDKAPEITRDIAAQLNSGSPFSRQLGAVDGASLTVEEKAAVLDAQALQLRGTVNRLQQKPELAAPLLAKALTDLAAIRQGRITSIARLRAQITGELAGVSEDRGDLVSAERQLRDALSILRIEYPGSAAVNAANARLAAFLGRHNQADAAIAIYRDVVSNITSSGGATTGFANMLAPYFELLLVQMKTQPALINDFFLASETLVRPGVADTQAVLARELSGGAGEAASLFRLSVNLTRDVERTRIELARLTSLPTLTPEEEARKITVQRNLGTLEREQVETQAKLGKFPQYRAISTQALTLEDLQKTLKAGEAYLKMAMVGDTTYLIFATSGDATAYRSTLGRGEIEKTVDALRDTISVVEGGQQMTYPFDLKLARMLYRALIEPVQDRLANMSDLVFEPDGALLRLPINLLVTEQQGVDRYNARIAKAGADDFDFTGVSWLGRRINISTSVSARSFRDTRQTPASSAKREYLGFGNNAPVSKFLQLTATRSMRSDNAVDCSWPLSAWDSPISPKELNTAQSIIGTNTSAVVTGAAFSDTSVKQRTDLDDYRIVHFATHGLVAAPRPECPARPALLTSFGGTGSDGLLTFQEIYDLRFNADLVILSACDTAGAASVSATREIGLSTGGGAALDGLVRAFIGAGSRSVLASHWPLPDDFGATQRIIDSLFTMPTGTSVSVALRTGQNVLMDDPNTSHPYYWAGLAMIGDGQQPVLRKH